MTVNTKKILAGTGLAASTISALAGCGQTKTDTNEELKQQIKKEVLVELENQEKEEIISEDNTLQLTATTNEIKELAQKSYTEYKAFYDYSNVTEEEVEVMVDIINGNVEGYTKDQINDSLALVQYALLSDNTLQLIDNCNAVKMNFPVDEEFTVIPSPKVSELFIDKDGLENVTSFEELREELVNEVISTGNYSDSMQEKINSALVSQEVNEYDSYNGNMDSSLNGEGKEYVITATKLSLTNLTIAVNPTSSFVKGETDEYQIAPRSDVNEQGYIESDILAQIYTLEAAGTEIPEDLALKRADIEMRLVGTKYINGLCTLNDQILKAAKIETSLKDLYNQKKEILEALKENEMLKGVNLTFTM